MINILEGDNKLFASIDEVGVSLDGSDVTISIGGSDSVLHTELLDSGIPIIKERIVNDATENSKYEEDCVPSGYLDRYNKVVPGIWIEVAENRSSAFLCIGYKATSDADKMGNYKLQTIYEKSPVDSTNPTLARLRLLPENAGKLKIRLSDGTVYSLEATKINAEDTDKYKKALFVGTDRQSYVVCTTCRIQCDGGCSKNSVNEISNACGIEAVCTASCYSFCVSSCAGGSSGFSKQSGEGTGSSSSSAWSYGNISCTQTCGKVCTGTCTGLYVPTNRFSQTPSDISDDDIQAALLQSRISITTKDAVDISYFTRKKEEPGSPGNTLDEGDDNFPRILNVSLDEHELEAANKFSTDTTAISRNSRANPIEDANALCANTCVGSCFIWCSLDCTTSCLSDNNCNYFASVSKLFQTSGSTTYIMKESAKSYGADSSKCLWCLVAAMLFPI